MKPVAVVRDPLCLGHSNGPGHPESPERLQAIERMLSDFPLRGRLAHLPARDASFEELARVHTPEYIRRIEATRGLPFSVLDPDTSASAGSHAAALRAAGGVLAAVEAVLGGGYAGAFAAVRPPGHHAEADRAMGFCLFNNAAVAARCALDRHGLRRVLLVDWDVHHGNGTMHSFYDSREVLYFSVHQYPHYPGTGRVEELGRGEGQGYTVNVPLPGGQGDAEYLAVFRELLRPLALAYRPELILVSAGFDILRDDPLADMRVTEAGVAGLTRAVGRGGRGMLPRAPGSSPWRAAMTCPPWLPGWPPCCAPCWARSLRRRGSGRRTGPPGRCWPACGSSWHRIGRYSRQGH